MTLLGYVMGKKAAAGGGGGGLTLTTRLTQRAVNHNTSMGSGDFTSSSFTTAASTLLVAILQIDIQDDASLVAYAAIPTPTTSGLTWTEKAGINGNSRWSTAQKLYVADNSSSGSKTIAFAGTGIWDTNINGCIISILEFGGALAASSQTATAGTYTADSGGGDPGAGSVTLPSAPASGSYVVAGYAGDGGGSGGTTVGSGFTEYAEYIGGTGGPYLSAQIQYRTGSTSTNVPWADLATGTVGLYRHTLFGWEVKAA